MEKGWVPILFRGKKVNEYLKKKRLFIAKILLFNTKKSDKGVGSQFFWTEYHLLQDTKRVRVGWSIGKFRSFHILIIFSNHLLHEPPSDRTMSYSY